MGTYKPVCIAIEGLDSSGKQTQANHLAQWIIEHTPAMAQVISFPRYGTPLGQAIRSYLIDESVDKRALQMLFSVDRYEFMRSRIWDMDYERPTVYIFDRFLLSGMAYGGEQTLDGHLGVVQPFTIYIDILPSESLSRSEARGGVDNNEINLVLQTQARDAYLNYFADRPQDEWEYVEGDRSESAVKEAVIRAFRHRYGAILEVSL